MGPNEMLSSLNFHHLLMCDISDAMRLKRPARFSHRRVNGSPTRISSETIEKTLVLAALLLIGEGGKTADQMGAHCCLCRHDDHGRTVR